MLVFCRRWWRRMWTHRTGWRSGMMESRWTTTAPCQPPPTWSHSPVTTWVWFCLSKASDFGKREFKAEESGTFHISVLSWFALPVTFSLRFPVPRFFQQSFSGSTISFYAQDQLYSAKFKNLSFQKTTEWQTLKFTEYQFHINKRGLGYCVWSSSVSLVVLQLH